PSGISHTSLGYGFYDSVNILLAFSCQLFLCSLRFFYQLSDLLYRQKIFIVQLHSYFSCSIKLIIASISCCFFAKQMSFEVIPGSFSSLARDRSFATDFFSRLSLVTGSFSSACDASSSSL